MHVLYVIFLEGLGSCTPEIMDIILIWIAYPRCPKRLCYLIKDLLVFFLDIVMIASDIIFSELGFVSNIKVSINVFCFCMVKGVAYPM